MQGRYWYLGLFVLSISIVAITYWKSRNKLMFPLLIGAASFAYLLEVLVHPVFKAYVFRPGFIQDKFPDSLLGAIISDFSLPSAAVLIAVFQLGWGWIFTIIGMFAGIETLFVKLGIFQLYWWKTYYTSISLFPFFLLVKWWFRRLNRPHGRTLTFVTLLAILFFARQQIGILIYLFLKSGLFTIGWIEARGVQSFVITAPISMLIATVLTSLIIFRARLIWIVAAVTGFFAMDLALFMLHIMQIRTYWHFVYLTVTNVLVLLIGQAFVRLLRENEVTDLGKEGGVHR